jgi:hypothetical protein
VPQVSCLVLRRPGTPKSGMESGHGRVTIIDRLMLLTAVNMLAPPSTQVVCRRLAVSRDEAEAALTEAKRAHLVAEESPETTQAMLAGINGHRWRLTEPGRAEMYRLLRAHLASAGAAGRAPQRPPAPRSGA